MTKSNPIVNTADGQLMGLRAYTESGTPYYAFRGIPFAKPPLGDLRFMPPEPVEPWDGVRDATYERNVSFQVKMEQPSMFTSLGEIWALVRNLPNIYRFVSTFSKQSEDCLYLNVLTPELPSSDTETLNIPVLFWIHGGAFVAGCGGEAFGKMDNMMDRGIVVVTINYRLGPFGFLSLDTPSAPGNAGMKDQVAALRWVQRNVSKFGGDPNRVTIYGISAGAASTQLLTVSPMATGLFHGAIAGSGGALCDWSVNTDHVRHAREFAKLLSIQADTDEDMAQALKKVPPKDIVKAFAKYELVRKDRTFTYGLVFTPSMERPGPNAFLSEHPETVLREGRQANVPLISGTVATEGALWYMFSVSKDDITGINQQRQMLMPLDLYDALPDGKREEVADEIVQFYCGEKGLCQETEQEFINIYGDINFVVKCLLASRLHASTSTAPVYMYRFTFDGRISGSRRFLKGTPCKGPSHGDDAGYFAPMIVISRPHLGPQEPETKVIQRFCGAVANFVKTGRPAIPDEVNPEGIVWEPITDNSMSYLEMGQEFNIRDDNFGPRMRFWNDLYKKYLNKTILVSSDVSLDA